MTKWLFLCFGLLTAMAVQADFSLEEMEALEKGEQTQLLELSRQAAKNWNFSEAEGYLARARNKGHAPGEIQAAEKSIADNRAAKAEKERREAEERRLAEMQRSQGSGSASGGSQYAVVTVEAEMSCGIFMGCSTKSLSVSSDSGSGGGFGWIEHSSSNKVNISYRPNISGRRGFAGWYTFFASFGNRSCSGKFYISGTKRYYKIRVREDCDDFGSAEY